MFTLFEINSSQIPLLFEVIKQYNLDGFIVERFFPLGTGKQLKDAIVSKYTWADSVKKLLNCCGMEQDLRLVAEYRVSKS